ncbi:MFS transporter [Bacillus manliponensis]|uniref:MFS transporter n=1 Tax=Bacillus manliponensis TaxID=574376 RepID=A0A073JZR9_9BACI|nr:MFS transporter [Bacillus manliponensis]KEK19740.1 MFS transporter [Bacillus manliponensis]
MTYFIKHYSKPIWIRMIGELLTSITTSMLTVIFIVHINKTLDGNITLTMLLFGLQPLTDIIFTLIAGGVTDRYGRKKLMVIGLILQAIAIGGFAFFESALLFAMLYIINGIGRSLYIPAQRAQITDLTKEEKRAEIFALLGTITAIGAVIGPLLGAFLYETYPMFLFLLQSVTLFSYAILVWTQLPETAPIIESSKEKLEKITWKSFFLNHHAIFLLMLCTLPISFFYAQTETNYRIFAEDLFSNFLFVLAFLATCKAVMQIALQIALVKWSEAFSMPKIMIMSYSCFTLAAIGYGFSNSLWLLFFTLLILTVGESIALNHLLRFVGNIAPSHMRGRYFSIYGLHWDISRTCGPFIGAIILQKYGGTVLFLICAGFLIIGGISQTIFTYILEQNRKTYTQKIS